MAPSFSENSTTNNSAAQELLGGKKIRSFAPQESEAHLGLEKQDEKDTEANDGAHDEHASLKPAPRNIAQLLGVEVKAFWPIALWIVSSVVVFLLCHIGSVLKWTDAGVIGLIFFMSIGYIFQPGGVGIELTSLAFMMLITSSQIVTFDKAWGAMATPSMWIIMCGMMMCAGLTETCISEYVAQFLLMGRPSWFNLVCRLHFAGFVSAIFIPSQIVRVQMVVPIIKGLLRRLQIENHTWNATALSCCLILSTVYCGTGILTGGVPNLLENAVFAPAAPEGCGTPLGFATWLVRMFVPWSIGNLVTGIFATMMLTTGLRCFCCAPLTSPMSKYNPEMAAGESKVALGVKEYKVIAILVAALVMWITGTWTGISTVTISLWAAILMFFPRYGPMDFQIAKQKTNFMVMLIVVAMTTLNPLLREAHVVEEGLKEFFSAIVYSSSSPLVQTILLSVMNIPLGLINVLIPIIIISDMFCNGAFDSLALNKEWGGMTVAASANFAIFPHQSIPCLIVGHIMHDTMKKSHFTAFIAANAMMNLVVLLPVSFGWFSALGWE